MSGGRHGYPVALGWTVGPALLAVIVATSLGPEAKGTPFGAPIDSGQAVQAGLKGPP